MQTPVKGSCLCGKVSFSVRRFHQQVAYCHCSMCRKFHGAASAPIIGVDRKDFQWLSGEEEINSYKADNGTVRSFCRHCGSSLTFTSAETEDTVIEVALGVLDDDIPITPDAHIYVDSKANWEHINDDLPQFPQDRDSDT